MNQDLLNLIQNQKAALDALRPIPQPKLNLIKAKFELEYNFYSNSIEGNTLTMGETNSLINLNLNATIAKRLRDIEEMRGHIKAADQLEFFKGKFENTSKPASLSQQFVKNLHHLIFVEDQELYSIQNEITSVSILKAGNYKTKTNSVIQPNGQLFTYASPESTPSLMIDLIDWYNSSIDTINPAVLAAIFHYKFIRIQPFGDGNGRMARLLMNYILISAGYSIVIITTEEKIEYITSLDLTNNNFIGETDFMNNEDLDNFEPFVAYILSLELKYLDIMIEAAKGE